MTRNEERISGPGTIAILQPTKQHQDIGPAKRGDMKTKYEKLVGSLEKQGARDPRALAAWIGRKKLGKVKFQKKAAAGLRKAK